ncbi:MAG: adenosine deaminase [Leptospiraceae bacterium]|nr:adenosine deaminase [Leptospiraceae bacterium]MCK6382408.1 adenosine deaminase [Leptospiraceae bacterium]NUM41112.1 adenosine deaminase [Leptospiraceae bacterium]
MNKYCDLHSHLYGAIDAEILLQIGKENPTPRWDIFIELHEKLFHEKIDPNTFFLKYGDINEFKKLSHFKSRAPFLEFQSKFNLVIALTKFQPEEIKRVCMDVMRKDMSFGASFSEYRIMYSPLETEKGYHEKTITACEGLKEAEGVLEKIQGRLIVSLHRDGDFYTQYKWLKNCMKNSEVVRKYLVGIDFCGVEENFPPKEKKDFFQTVNSDNLIEPQYALSILYHVGESFGDKTPISTVRWIYETSKNGAHRLGHCLALGLDPKIFTGKNFVEKVSERIDELKFEIDNYKEIGKFGSLQPIEKKIVELGNLQNRNLDELVTTLFDSYSEMELKTFQEFAMKKLAENKTVIESCPTSNLRIGRMEKKENHPLKRFIEKGLRVTIGTDDSGIFDTNIQKEYELAESIGVAFTDLEKIREDSFLYLSEKLSGKN